MNRRSGIKTLLIISAGAAFLPACLTDKKKSSLSLKNIRIDDQGEEILAELSETIIPKSNTPGAKDVSAHLFALMMVDDCYSPDNRDKFEKGFTEFEEFTKERFGSSFTQCNAAQRMELLQSVESKNNIPPGITFFYDSMKKLTIQAFTSSEYYLTKVHIYKLVPGKFYGCIPVKKAS